jgi:hypothetical protein
MTALADLAFDAEAIRSEVFEAASNAVMEPWPIPGRLATWERHGTCGG